ncbi:hypothetical protein D0Z07_3583 [Hyphodiscus hymeniophilus]|uniref:Modin n=1 Tax=Hyphodiscus hymeniophilus TaxID=353542 RepID=A0A9P6VLV9_9HELO|nr:hypothetical protein D0Z07_3583 [Hyphodiscus hymeniophilus]
MGFDNLNQNVFGLVALIVSLVALVSTVLQVLQQYYSDAEGYRRCADSVMGLWSSGTRRRIRWSEFRFEVLFETPVIFLSSPENRRGPIKERDIYYIDGTDESYIKTQVRGKTAQKEVDAQISRVHTADDERATWVNLLSMLQREEEDSREWDKNQMVKTPPKNPARIIKPPDYRLVVGMQKKTRSWDFMPGSITKPYATSAVCHLIEMAAVMGMYWKLFDPNLWNLRAEGNGFILTSTTVHGLGVMVVFSITGKSEFTDRRVIPCEEIKQLAFGTVPNIFEDDEYLRREKDAQSLDLVFGANDEVAATLESLGCHSETIKRYEQDHKHIFSVSFEIIGMLGKVFRIRGSSFRMLPNPTSDPMVKQVGRKPAWKIARLMHVFQDKLKELLDGSSPNFPQSWSQNNPVPCPQKTRILLNAASTAEGFVTDHPITIISTQWQTISSLGCADEAYLSIESREAVHDAVDKVDMYLLGLQQAVILSVVVAHLNNVLEVLSNPDSPLNTIVLANKEEMLLSHYFYELRPAVIGNLDAKGKPLTREEKDVRNTIWISLIFRMLCWLLLHDFDKADVKIVPSDLMGSRMPIFIS